jgi:nucleotide-binding universal stress UspA family protein
MSAMQRILCAVDFSSCSQSALEQAVAIARCSRAELTVVHAWQTPSPFDLVGPAYETPGEAIEPPGLRLALQEFVLRVVGDTDTAIRLVHGTHAGRAVLAEAEAVATDLLVIGSHGRVGFDRFLLGSTSNAIVRKSSCPVLVVPPGGVPSQGRFRRILCGMDFSAASLQAFRFAVGHVAAADAEVRLLNVIEMPPELREQQIVAAFDVDAVRAAAEASARQRLEALYAGDAAPGMRIVPMVTEGLARQRILEIARREQADLIVLGAHGRSALDRWMFGSHTDAVLHDAPCPVLTVRPGESS